MRNYYATLEIDRTSDELEVLDSVEAIESNVESAYFDDVKSTLTDSDKSMHYRRLHLQYDAIAAVLARDIPQHDSNSWSKRVVEFAPEPNDLP